MIVERKGKSSLELLAKEKDNTSYILKACSAKFVLPGAVQIMSGPTEHLLNQGERRYMQVPMCRSLFWHYNSNCGDHMPGNAEGGGYAPGPLMALLLH